MSNAINYAIQLRSNNSVVASQLGEPIADSEPVQKGI